MSDLDRLIEAIELGDWVGQFDDVLNVKQYKYAAKAYHGSLDAARTLHEALLGSGFHAEIWACCTRPRVKVVRGEEVHDGHEQITEARSWLISILKAYRSLK